MILNSFFALLIMGMAHVLTTYLKFSAIPRSKWLSAAGGISVAYIFLSAFPELHEYQIYFTEEAIFSWMGLEHQQVYLFALLGLVLFYGLEHKARQSKPGEERVDSQQKAIYRVHMASFALYNFMIGYLLLEQEERSLTDFILYALAMAFHFMVTDHALETQYREKYRSQGRWLLVGVLAAGWVGSLLIELPEVGIGSVFAFLCGGIVLNTLKEELPEERESNLPAFIGGILAYGFLLLLVG